MDLKENSFYILKANVRDNLEKIDRLTEDCSLELDSEKADEARNNLINPRKRLESEIAWLPGISPNRSNKIFSEINIYSIEKYSNTLPNICLANITINLIKNLSINEIVAGQLNILIKFLIKAVESFEVSNIQSIINEDRVVAQLPLIQSKIDVEEEIEQRKKYYIDTINIQLKSVSLDNQINILKSILESKDCSIKANESRLISKIIDKYILNQQQILDLKRQDIYTKVRQTYQNSFVLNSDIVAINQLVSDWAIIAKPIQLSFKNRGIRHKDSLDIGYMLRELAINELLKKRNLKKMAQSVFLNTKIAFKDVQEINQKCKKDEADFEALTIDRNEDFDDNLPVENKSNYSFSDILSLNFHFRSKDESIQTITVGEKLFLVLEIIYDKNSVKNIMSCFSKFINAFRDETGLDFLDYAHDINQKILFIKKNTIESTSSKKNITTEIVFKFFNLILFNDIQTDDQDILALVPILKSSVSSISLEDSFNEASNGDSTKKEEDKDVQEGEIKDTKNIEKEKRKVKQTSGGKTLNEEALEAIQNAYEAEIKRAKAYGKLVYGLGTSIRLNIKGMFKNFSKE